MMMDRVERCIKILDKIFPTWKGRINWKTLDLQNPTRCILGQIFGNYETGLQIFKRNGYDDLVPWRYGVSLKFDEINESNWNRLHDTWASKLRWLNIVSKPKKFKHAKCNLKLVTN